MCDSFGTRQAVKWRRILRAKGNGADFRRARVGVPAYDQGQEQPPTDRAVAVQPNVSELDTLADLLFATGQGDRRAFARLYQLAAPSLFAIAMRLMRQRDLAEDVVQEAFVAIWRRAGQYQLGRGLPMAWMAAVVRNRAIDRLRKRTREPNVAANLDDLAEVLGGEVHGPAAPMSAAGVALRECLGRLKENQQRAILLAYYHGLTHEELAMRLDRPLGTVKSAVRRGLLQLKECLER